MKKSSPPNQSQSSAQAFSREGQRAVFLDRDGVLTKDKDYTRVSEFELLPGVGEALRILKDRGFLLIVVTNQSGVARGFFPIEEVHEFHRRLQLELQAFGVQIDAFYLCPHHPKGSVQVYSKSCPCRKPATGMLEQAAKDFPIDMKRSYLVGDKPSDMECAKAGGITGIKVTLAPKSSHEVKSLREAVSLLT